MNNAPGTTLASVVLIGVLLLPASAAAAATQPSAPLRTDSSAELDHPIAGSVEPLDSTAVPLAERSVEQGGAMSDNAATRDDGSNTPMTVADVLRGVEPMGDLRQFAIDDLTPDDEDEFFRILDGA